MPHLASRTRLMRGRTGGSQWQVATRSPGERLRAYTHGDYVGYTERTDAPISRREFAVPFAVLVIEFGPPTSVSPGGDLRARTRHVGGFFGGLDDRFAICEHNGLQQGVQLNLSPIGARLLFGIPMSELTGRILSIRDVLPVRHRNLGDRLQEVADWDTRFEALDDALADCLIEAREKTSIVAWAVRRIEQSGGDLEVRALGRELATARSTSSRCSVTTSAFHPSCLRGSCGSIVW